MNGLKYKGLTVAERVVVYFELAKDATLMSTQNEMVAAAIALLILLQDSDIDNKAVANRLRKEAERCGIISTAVMSAIDGIERG